MIIYTDQKNFNKVKQTKKLFILDVFASWCGPCQMIAKEFENLDHEEDLFFDIVKINSDENYELASSLKVSVLPTLIIFKDGEEVERLEGFRRANDIMHIMEKHK